MKSKKRLVIVAIILVSIWLVKNGIYGWYSRNYDNIDQQPHSEHLDFVIKPVSHNDIEFHYNNPAAAIILDSNGAAIPDTLPAKDNYRGWIFFDTLRQQYYFKETFYKQLPEQPDAEYTPHQEIERWITLSKNGKQIDSTAIDSLMPPRTAILLEDAKGNFPNWSDKKSVAYINFFARERFNWDKFNVFKGMGSPTGGRSQPYWYGHAYYTLNHCGEKIQFKAEAERYGNADYGDNIHFSATPTRFKNIPLLSFIILKRNQEKSGLYVVVRK